MGKKKRATTAAWRAAAAERSLPLPTTTSLAIPLVATIASADPLSPNAANEPPAALTQQPNDSHTRTACPTHPAPSIAPHTTSGSPNAISAPRNTSPASFATEYEPDGNLEPATAKPREPRSVQTHPAPATISRTPNAHTTTPHTSRVTPNRAARPRTTKNDPQDEVGPSRDKMRTASDAREGGPQLVRTPASPVPHTRAATPHDVPSPPRLDARPRAPANELKGHPGVRVDDTTSARTYLGPSPVSPTSHMFSTAPNDGPAFAHNDIEPLTPGIEPGEPRPAAAYEPREELDPPSSTTPQPEPMFTQTAPFSADAEPDVIDRAYHDEMVAIAIQKGFEAGMKTGRNEGFREGLEVGTKTARSACEKGRKEGSERGGFEVSASAHVVEVQTHDAIPHRNISTATPPPELSTTPSMPCALATPVRPVTSIEEIDTDLLTRVRKEAEYGVWEEGLEAGMTMGRKEGREAGYNEGLEAGRKMGMMEGRERGFEDGKSAGVQAGRVLERVEVRRIARPSVHVQSNNRFVRTYIDAAVRTSESLPTPHAHVGMQTLPLYAAAMPFIEDPDPALLDPTHLKEIVVTALSDGHAAGLKEGWHVGLQEGTATGRKIGMIEGRERGFDEGKSAGVKIGRDLECAAAHRIVCCSIHVQTDTLLGNVCTLADSTTRLGERRHPICIDSPMQTKPYIHIESAAQKVPKMDPIPTALSPAPFSWADDADSLPLIPVPPLCSMPARDFSDLQSSLVSQPFGSIQRRVRRSQQHTNQARQFCRYRSLPSTSSSWRSSIRPANPIHPVQHHASDLEWATDPRLSELSRVLQGLGWVHSSFSSGQVSEATRTLPCRRGAHGVGRQGLPPSRGWVSSGV